MPNPKRRHSKSRTRKRRAHFKTAAPSISICANCGEPKLQHRACPSCGFYKGRTMFVPKAS
jgi:large subunit ribosomal protein L32